MSVAHRRNTLWDFMKETAFIYNTYRCVETSLNKFRTKEKKKLFLFSTMLVFHTSNVWPNYVKFYGGNQVDFKGFYFCLYMLGK